MTDELPVAEASPDIRPVVWRGYPLQYAIPVVTGLLGVLLLLLGGAAAWFGGWWLATAFPVAIGSFFRDPRLAAVPVLVWALWVVVGAVAGPDAALANTPIPVAAVLAGVGAAATYGAQRVIFPATDPEVIEEIRNGRTVPTLDDFADAGPSVEPLPVEDADDLDPALVELFEVAEVDDEGDDERASEADANADVEDENDAGAPAPGADVEREDASEDTEPDADAEREDASEDTDAADVEREDASDAEDDDADPDDPLDEGQHVAEFAAITEADLEQADAGAPVTAVTRPGKRRGKR